MAAEAARLDEGGGGHGEDRDDVAGPDSLEGREAAGPAGAGPEPGHGEALVDRDEDEGVDRREDRDGAGGDEDLCCGGVREEGSVHYGGLGDEEGGELGEGDRQGDR